MLESGDLIFVKENTEMGQAIQASTGNYSHVAIFLDGKVYHATAEGGVLAQSPEDFFEVEKVYDLYRYPKIDHKEVKKQSKSRQRAFWVRPTILPFIRMEMVSIVPNLLQKSSLFLRPFP